MRRFAAGDLDVLVATTVIEVGVNVPNATAMVIMDADRFGVSQLHQLRGRVGRGSAGLCLLVTEMPEASPARQRLGAVASTLDGFELSASTSNSGARATSSARPSPASAPPCGSSPSSTTRRSSPPPARRPPPSSSPTRTSPPTRACAPPSTPSSTRTGRSTWRRADRPPVRPRPYPETYALDVRTGRRRTRTPMTRVIAGTAGGRRLAVPPGNGTRPPPTGRARASSPPGRRSSAPSTGPGSPTCTRAPAPSASKRSPGAPPTPSSSRPTPRRADDPGERPGDRPAGRGTPYRQGRADRDRTGPADPYDLVFLDPPYAVEDAGLREILLTLRSGGWLGEDALVTVERSTRGGEFGWPAGFEPLRARRYGEGTFWYGRAASTCEDAR